MNNVRIAKELIKIAKSIMSNIDMMDRSEYNKLMEFVTAERVAIKSVDKVVNVTEKENGIKLPSSRDDIEVIEAFRGPFMKAFDKLKPSGVDKDMWDIAKAAACEASNYHAYVDINGRHWVDKLKREIKGFDPRDLNEARKDFEFFGPEGAPEEGP